MKRDACIGALVGVALLLAGTHWGAGYGGQTAAEAVQPEATRIAPGASQAGHKAATGEKGKEYDTGIELPDRGAAARGGDRPAGTERAAVQSSLGSGETDVESVQQPGAALAKGSETREVSRDRSRAADDSDPATDLHHIGTFKLTAYTAGVESTGKRPGDKGYGEVAISGSKRANFATVKVKEDHTIAADWGVLPPGTVVWIEGVGRRVVEDKGGAVKGKHIDVYMPKLQDAQTFGVSKANVYVIEWGS